MKDLILYHGTDADFSVVDLKHAKDKKDFGKGFYTTTDINQAIALAKNMQMRAMINGNPRAKAYVYAFKINREELKSLNSHNFQTASISWIDYILKNRYSNFRNQPDYDLVIGRVADVVAMRVMNQFIKEYGLKAEKEQKLKLIKALKPDNLIDQYCFKTDKATDILNKAGFRRKEY